MDWLVGADRQSVADGKMESFEYSYNIQLNNHIQVIWVEIFLVTCWQSLPRDTVYNFQRRKSADPLEIKIEMLAMRVSGSLLVRF